MRRRPLAFAAACLAFAATCLAAQPAARELGLELDLGLHPGLDLEQALALAESNSAELEALQARRSLDRERLRLACRAFLPRLELSYARNDAVVYASPDSRSRRLSADLQMLLYAGGERVAERGRQKSALRLGEANIAAARQELQLAVVRRFIQILSLHLQQELLGDSRRSTEQQVAIAREEWRVGEITELEYLGIAVAAKQLELQQARLQAEEAGLLFELRQLAGLSPEQPLRVLGRINLDFPGLLEAADPEVYLNAARDSSLELRRRRAELDALTDAARRARFAWVPSLSAEAELSASGEGFPLTEPGFSVGLSLDFRAPVLPARLAASAGGYGPGERSLSGAASVAVGENLEAVQASRLARLELQTATALFEDFRAGLEFSIRRSLQERQQQLHALQLRRENAQLQGKRQEVLALMLELGEVTRSRFVEGEIELARLRVELVAAVAALFELEAGLLERCGLPLPPQGFRRIILPEQAP